MGDSTHVFKKIHNFFLFLGNLGCLVRIGFYNGLWRGRQCVGVVTRSRAYVYSVPIIYIIFIHPRWFTGFQPINCKCQHFPLTEIGSRWSFAIARELVGDFESFLARAGAFSIKELHYDKDSF